MATKKYVDAAMTPYRLAEVLSEITGTHIRPQQLYAAARPNEDGEARLKFRYSETGTKVVDPDDANEFIQDFLDRREARAKRKAEKEAEDQAAQETAEQNS